MTGVFAGCQVALDLTTSVKFKEKAKLRKSITENGGIVSYIVTKKSTLVVCNDAEKADISYKVKMAAKYGIPVVSMAYIDQSVEAGKLLNTDDYLLVGKTKAEELGSGKISASQYQKKEKKKQMKPIYNINSYKSWKADDKNCPGFPRDFHIAKFAVFRAQMKDKNRQYSVFTVLEVHVAEHVEKLDNSDTFKFRVLSHSGMLKAVEQGDKGVIEYRFCSTSEEALFLYTHLYSEKLKAPHNMELVHDMFSRHIGSEKFQQMMSELGLESETVSPPVGELVEHVWREAMGELESIISVPVTSVKSEQLEKAEAILKQIKEALDINNSTGELIEEFYSLIPHHKIHRVTFPTKAWLSRKQDLCQLIKDMVSVSEATDWSMRSGTQSKYKALRCTIEHVTSADGMYKTLKNKFLTSLVAASREQDSSFEIQNIYAVTRPVENSNFAQDIDNKQFLYHSSRVENFVGILSRGLMLPKVVVDDFGGTRSDPGMLGSGIYFASDPRTSVAYSTASKTKGTRLMLVNEVALGNCLDTTQKDLTLTYAPEGYQSVHGVKARDDQPSDFKNDEYVVYNTEQQRIKYLIEFTVADDTILELEGIGDLETDLFEDVEYLSQEIDLHDVKNILDPMSKVKPGLVSTGDTPVDLKGVHIRAKLLDMASEVVVLQEYYNNSVETLEAKYVFPLGDMAAVCGFEAFINGKHIVGEVKEKETAHKEYKKAVSEGHGAYLMDQDEETPDVFTVSVGNLPPGASVLIKITYVAELQVEGELISFRLPGSVAPWKRDTALKDITQHDTDTVEVKQGETTVQVAIEMPFDIRSIECPTNKVRVKKTLTKATVELLENQSIEDGFQLLVGLAEIHVPRMWVEKKTGDLDHQACMLSFYPEFEACEDDNVEVVFLFDLSNSMKGDNLRDAKKVLLLTLQHLPAQWQFNVVVFGTAFKELFPSCVAKNPSNLKKATEFIKSLSATMGNTEVIRPMHTFYLLRHESSIQNVFLLSDGHINNEETMLSNAMNHSQHTRIFTMGVSATANRHLLRALARVGAGAYEFFDSKVKSKWEAKVKSHISKAAQPGLTSVSVDWEQHGADVPHPVQAPRQITALFSGSRQVVYGYVPNCLMATLKANIAGHEVSTVVSTSDLSTTQGKILHRLTARAIISDWEDGVLSPDRTDHEIVKMNTKKFIIELSKEYSIVTQFTSFVAIEKRDKDEVVAADVPTMAELVEREDVDQLTYMGFEKRKESILYSEYSGEECEEYAEYVSSLHSDYAESYSEYEVMMDYESEDSEAEKYEEEIEGDLMGYCDSEYMNIEPPSSRLESIEANVAKAQETVREGTQELAKARAYQRYNLERELMEVKQIMAESMDTVLERGEMLDSLVEKSEMLSRESAAFKRASEMEDREFYANLPPDLQNVNLPPKKPKPATTVEPFNLDTDIRGSKKAEEWSHKKMYSPVSRELSSRRVVMASYGAEEEEESSEDDWSEEERDEGKLEREVQWIYHDNRSLWQMKRQSAHDALKNSTLMSLMKEPYRERAFISEPPETGTLLRASPEPLMRVASTSMSSPELLTPVYETYMSAPLEGRALISELPKTREKIGEEKSRAMAMPLTTMLDEESESEEEMGFGLFDDDFGYSAEQKREVKEEPPILTAQSFRSEIHTRQAAEARTALEAIVAAPWETTVQAQQSQVPRYTTGGPQAPPPPLISRGSPPPPPPPVVPAGHIAMAASGGAPPEKLLARLSGLSAQTLSAPVAPSPHKPLPMRSKMSFKRTPPAPPPVPAGTSLSPAADGVPPPPPPPPPKAIPANNIPLATAGGSPDRSFYRLSRVAPGLSGVAPIPLMSSKMSFKRTPSPPDFGGGGAPPPPLAAGGAPPPPPPAPTALKDVRADTWEIPITDRKGPPTKGFESKSSYMAVTADMFLKDTADDKSGAAKQMKEKKLAKIREVTRRRESEMSLKDAKEESVTSASSVSWRLCDSREARSESKLETRFMKPIPAKRAAKKAAPVENVRMAKCVTDEAPLVYDVYETAPKRATVRELQPLLLGEEPHMEGHGYMQKDFTPKTLDQYGIGTHIPSILHGVPSLSAGSLDKLFKLQDKVSGSWTMTTELEKLLGIDFSVCKNLLIGAGLSSLGSRVMEQVLLLVSTFIVLLCILKTLRPELFPVDFSHQQAKFAAFYEGFTSLMKLEASQPLQSGSLVDGALLAMAFCGNLDKEYPLIYSTLELGHSWEEVVASMLGMHEAQGSLKKLEDSPAWSLWEKYSFSDFHKELLVK